MKLTNSFFLLCLFGAALAHYPYPNYEPVVVSRSPAKKPSKIIVIPEEVYKLPQVRVPSVVYGVPAKTADVVVKTVKPEKPSETYGVPDVPSTTYGVPVVVKTVKPEKPSETYGVPDVPSTSYGVPVVVKTVKPEKPSETYGVPDVPSTSYGVPVQRVPVPSRTIINYVLPNTLDLDLDIEEPSNSYGVPKPSSLNGEVVPLKPSTPFKVYTVPKPTAPAVEYGVPVQVYKLPEVRVPTVEYGVPSQEYGVPQVKVPATTYGLF